ncbi:unnamed protein product [Rotaria sp. Silwood2]|nr:unnamed protein product [Rotaria sp. Silwood2]
MGFETQILDPYTIHKTSIDSFLKRIREKNTFNSKTLRLHFILGTPFHTNRPSAKIINNDDQNRNDARIFPDAQKYVRNWICGDIIGQGVFTYQNGGRYEGNFKLRGGKEGNGTFYVADGGKYVGSWMNNYPNGQGAFTWPNGDRYEGSFRDGEMHGNGVFYYADGRKYIGSWINGKSNGPGVLTWNNETQKKEFFKKIKMLSGRDIGKSFQRPFTYN